MKKNNKGFTVVELLIVAFIMFLIVGVFFVGIVGAICMGNYWFTEASALKAIQFKNPAITEIVKVDRNVFGYSVIYAEDSDKNRFTYDLDTDVFWNHEVSIGGEK